MTNEDWAERSQRCARGELCDGAKRPAVRVLAHEVDGGCAAINGVDDACVEHRPVRQDAVGTHDVRTWLALVDHEDPARFRSRRSEDGKRLAPLLGCDESILIEARTDEHRRAEDGEHADDPEAPARS